MFYNYSKYIRIIKLFYFFIIKLVSYNIKNMYNFKYNYTTVKLKHLIQILKIIKYIKNIKILNIFEL